MIWNEVYTEEQMEQQEEDNATYLMYFWGLVKIWMVTLGALLYWWYPSLISRDNWWKL
jgi:hypothetical protein